DAITAEQVGMYLNVIGADCECGLDRSWMQGTMLPVAWDETRREATAAALAFDPEDPMVKMEHSMALSKSAHIAPGSTAPSLSSITYGYQETVVDTIPEGGTSRPEEFVEAPSMPALPPTELPATVPVAPAESLPLSTLALLAIVTLVLLGAVVLVVLRNR